MVDGAKQGVVTVVVGIVGRRRSGRGRLLVVKVAREENHGGVDEVFPEIVRTSSGDGGVCTKTSRRSPCRENGVVGCSGRERHMGGAVPRRTALIQRGGVA